MKVTSNNKRILEIFVNAINRHDWSTLRRVVSPNFVRHSYAAGTSEVRSLDQLIDFLKSESNTFPDGKEELLDMVAEGDKVAARHSFVGTQSGQMGPYPPTGKVLRADYLAIYRIENGLIAESWAEWDNLYGLSQLGHL